MSSFLCFLCHSTVNSDTNEETREKYREVVGMNLCPDSHLCYICCHVLNKLWLFKSVCLKRSLEYPVLFSEKGTINLQRNDLEIHALCPDNQCVQYHNRNFNSETFNFHYTNYCDNFEKYHDYHIENQYVELEDDRNEFDKYFNTNNIIKETTFEPKATQTDLVTNVENFSQVDINDFENEFRGSPVIENYENQGNEDLFDDADDFHDDDVDETRDIVHNDLEEDLKQDEFNCNASETDLNEELNHITAHDNNEDLTNISEYNIETNDVSKELHDTDNTVERKNKKKKKKKEKNSFKKIVLTTEEQKSELEKKRKETKYLEADFKCYNCALGFLFKDTYQTHMMRHEEQVVQQKYFSVRKLIELIEICLGTFTIRWHFLICTILATCPGFARSNGEYLCPICALRFAYPRVLRAHVTVHSVRWRCVRCGARIRARGRRHHESLCWASDVGTACHLCGQTFQSSDFLQQHLKRVHITKTSNKTYSCSVCGKSYNNQAAVRAHMFKHINRSFPCDRCPSVLSSPYLLAEHKKKHESTDLHYCATCNVSFCNRKGLLKHRRTTLAHKQNIIECPFCGRVYATRQTLDAHIQAIHHATENFACPACPARYGSRQGLNRHIKTHSGKRETKVSVCHLCGASFKGNSKLNRHLKTVCEKAKLEEQFTELYEQ